MSSNHSDTSKRRLRERRESPSRNKNWKTVQSTKVSGTQPDRGMVVECKFGLMDLSMKVIGRMEWHVEKAV